MERYEEKMQKRASLLLRRVNPFLLITDQL